MGSHAVGRGSRAPTRQLSLNVVDSTGGGARSCGRPTNRAREIIENIFTRTGRIEVRHGRAVLLQTAIALHAKPTEFPPWKPALRESGVG